MKRILIIPILFLIALQSNSQHIYNYLDETEEAFNKRMAWFTDAKYGMFIHFGLYSHLGGFYNGEQQEGYAEWIQSKANIRGEEYQKLLNVWNPAKFDANKIARLAKKAGMKYLVVTTKHHEGFCLWDSEFTNYDIAETPLKGRDLIDELANACKKEKIHFGTYYSIIDWHHPSQYISEEKGKDKWKQPDMKPGRKQEYVKYIKNQIKELIDNYDTEIVWFDGDWVDWWEESDGADFYNYIRNMKPEIIINNRVSRREVFKKDFGTPEQFHPDEKLNYYWEACYTMNHSWGYKKNDTEWKTPDVVYHKLTDINAKGGNFLLNIGPDGEGKIPKESKKILLKVGKMLCDK
jgi:alpha-L-fucosidase